MVEVMNAALPLEPVNMVGVFDLPDDGLVSSLALTPDGCYVFAAFGGGEVRIYAQALGTVGAASRNGTIVAQIESKGMFCNTKVDCHVEASEDGRFVFAGLLRGSSELVALDITELPRWGTLPTREELSLAPSRFDLKKLIRLYSHSDGKLKGFGAVAAVRTGPDRSEWGKEYRLFCGRGIKNIHVWSFKPQSEAKSRVSGGGRLGDGKWTCLYDTGTNGATVELVAFRNGGLEGISKSNDVNVRVWDLSNEDRRTKPSFRDISNSKDTRVVFGDYAYGGTTELSLVKLDAPAAANRMEIALPDAGITSPLARRSSPLTGRSSPLAGRSPPSARGKRHCRMLKDLAGTQDGRHVVLVCSDGTVLYHRHTQTVNTMRLEPLEGVGVDEDDARPTVALSLAGRAGLPVLMIAGGRGCGVATTSGEERRMELVLKALPRSDAQQLEDSQVMRLDSLGRPLLAWPEGRRFTPGDRRMDSDSCVSMGRNIERGRQDQGETVRHDTIHGNERTVTVQVGSVGGAAIVSSAATVNVGKAVAAVQSSAPDAPAAPAAPESPATPAAPSTPVSLHYRQNHPTAAATFFSQRLESNPDSSSPLPTDLQRSASPSPSLSGIDPHRFFTPVSAGRLRPLRHDGGKATAPGSSPPMRSPVGPSPGGSGSRGGRKKRGPAGASGHGRPRAGSMSSLGSSPAQASPTGDASSTESRVLGTERGGVALDVVGEKAARSGVGDDGRVHDPAELNPRKGSVGTGMNVAAGDDGTEGSKTDDVRGGEALSNSGGSGGDGIETLSVGEEKDTAATVRKNESAPEVHARAANVEATLDDGGGGGGGRDGSGGGGFGERKRRGTLSGASAGRGASVGRRPGKKRTREDHEKGAGDESGVEEGETTAAPLKRGRRGAGSGLEEGGHSSRGGGKARRSNSHGADDDGGDQVLLRDRRSRIAARALRSSGNVFDIGAIVKGITARMTESGQPEELRVVRVAERDVVVDPPAVPAGLMNFLTKREERKYQESTTAVVRHHSPLDILWAESSAVLQNIPISLERARALYNAGLKLLPHPSSAYAADGDGEGDVGNSFVSEAGKKRGVEKNTARNTREEGDSSPPSRYPHDVVSQPLSTEAFQRQHPTGVVRFSPHDQGRISSVGAAVLEGNGTTAKDFEEGYGKLRSAIAHEILAPDPLPQSILSCGDTRGIVSSGSAEAADARSAHESSRGSRRAGRSSVEEDPYARSAPAALQWHQSHPPSVTPACSEPSPGGAIATACKSGVLTGVAWEAVTSATVVGGVEDIISRRKPNPAPREARALPLEKATPPSSSSRASAGETRYVRPGAGKYTSNNPFAMEGAPSVGGERRKLATARTVGTAIAEAENPTASNRDAEAVDVDMDLEVEVDSEVDVVDDGDEDQKAEVHVGEDSVKVAESSASAVSRQDSRDRAAAAAAAAFAAAAAALARDNPGSLSASVAAGRETAFPARALSGKVGPSSSSEEGATTRSVDIGGGDATARVAALADGRKGPKKADVGKGKADAPGSRAVETPVAGLSLHAAATAAAEVSAMSWSVHKSTKRGGKSTASATPAGATAAAPLGPSVFPPPLESVIDMSQMEGERGSGGGIIDRVYGEHCLEREAVARAFFDEQDALRRRFLAAVDLVELDKAVECAGLELRNGCRAAQTLKARLKTRWQDQTVLPVGGGGLSRCTGREAQQATLRWQEQIRAIILDYKELLCDLLGRQRLEAGALQMAQEMELSKGKAPPLTVRFAFPGIFDEVAQRHRIKLPL